MDWDWEFSIQILPQLWEGVKVTIQATILGTIHFDAMESTS